MIDDSEKRNSQLGFELQNLHVCEKRSNYYIAALACCGKQALDELISFQNKIQSNPDNSDLQRNTLFSHMVICPSNLVYG